jgi:hypothetical protein
MKTYLTRGVIRNGKSNKQDPRRQNWNGYFMPELCGNGYGV